MSARPRPKPRRSARWLAEIDVHASVPTAGAWSIAQGKAATVHEPVFVLDHAGRIVAAFTTMTEADDVVRSHNSRQG